MHECLLDSSWRFWAIVVCTLVVRVEVRGDEARGGAKREQGIFIKGQLLSHFFGESACVGRRLDLLPEPPKYPKSCLFS